MDLPLAHLDRPFDYLVPADLDAAARPGVRVKVRFAGQLLGQLREARGVAELRIAVVADHLVPG
ncbi:primosomal protein N' family DNA-binding protein, partial [Micromonospora sp. NPDC003776]